MKIFALTLFCLLAGLTTSLSAQESYGHLNMGDLVASMSETTEADSLLRLYRDSLSAAVDTMTAVLYTDYQNLVKQVESGDLPPVQQQKLETGLQNQQQQLAQFQQMIPQLVQQRREKLLLPIVQKAEAAIRKVARDNGYKMVFDTSLFNAVLFAQDSRDIMPLVMSELGIETP